MILLPLLGTLVLVAIIAIVLAVFIRSRVSLMHVIIIIKFRACDHHLFLLQYMCVLAHLHIIVWFVGLCNCFFTRVCWLFTFHLSSSSSLLLLLFISSYSFIGLTPFFPCIQFHLVFVPKGMLKKIKIKSKILNINFRSNDRGVGVIDYPVLIL